MKNLKTPCPSCQKTYTANAYKLGFSILYVGTCSGCNSTHTSLAGSPGTIMFDSMRLSELFLNSAFTAGEALGIKDPFVLEPEEILKYATQ
jgi:hypothetical protein